MNPNDIPEAGWLTSFLMTSSKWINPIVHLIGLCIAICAFRRCRKWGYLAFAFYFALVIFSQLAMPAINRAIRAHHPPDYSEQTQKKLDAAIKQATEQVLAQEKRPYIPVSHVNFQLGSMVLVFALWLVAKKEPRHPAAALEPPSAESPGSP